MKLRRQILIAILKYAITQIERKDLELWEILIAVLRYAASEIEKAEQ